jgi:hypothetical protein
MLEQLALGDARVAHQADVHVAAQPHAVRQAARDAADEREQQRLLDVAVAEDLRGERAGEPVVDVGCRGRGVDRGGQRLVLGRRRVALLVVVDARRLQEGLGQQRRRGALGAAVAAAAHQPRRRRLGEEDAADHDRVPGAHRPRHLAAELDGDGARRGARRHFEGKLLELDLLVLDKLGAAGLQVQDAAAVAPSSAAAAGSGAPCPAGRAGGEGGQRGEDLACDLLVDLEGGARERGRGGGGSERERNEREERKE